MPHSLLFRLCALCLLLILVTDGWAEASSAAAEADPQLAGHPGTDHYIRVLGEGKSASSLQVALVRFIPRGATNLDRYVDLISAVHVADRAYYQDLNQRFETYDAVLFEMVLKEPEPDDSQAPAEEATESAESGDVADAGETTEAPKMSMVSRLQVFMKDTLGLSFQLDEVDYSPANMVHADMTQAEFEASMDQRGESIFSMMATVWLASLSQAPKTSNMDMILAFLSSNRELAFKRIAARELAGSEDTFDQLEGEEGSTLISERNRKALAVLREQLDAGQQRVAIFYGAGHMKDMAARLENEFAMQPHSLIWLDAWDLSAEASTTESP